MSDVCSECKTGENIVHNGLCEGCDRKLRNRIACKKYREKNKERIRQRSRERYKKNAKNEKMRQKEYYQENRESVRKRARAKYIENREKEISRVEKYRNENREKVLESYRRYYLSNRDKRIKDGIKFNKERREKDPIFRMRDNISKNVNSALKKSGTSKQGKSFFDIIGYCSDDLKKHLESKFEGWMSWDNYGKYEIMKWDDNDPSTWTWNIDHIIPQSSFDFKSPEDDEFKQCWALDNLRPINSKTNLKKGNKIR